jgi:hypothetical protein
MSDESTRYDAFEKRMHEEYPKMFSKPYGGFAIGEGWWPIVDKLCERIQTHIDWNNHNAAKYPEDKHYTPIEQVVVAQIKEKFGGLRFYYDGGDNYVRGLVEMAEAWAGRTCEVCGEPGKIGGDGWISTLCPTHRAERDALRNKHE